MRASNIITKLSEGASTVALSLFLLVHGRAFEVYDVVARGPAEEAGLKVGELV